MLCSQTRTGVLSILCVTCTVVVNVPARAADQKPTKLTCNGRAFPAQGSPLLNEISIDAMIDYASGRRMVVVEDDDHKSESASNLPTYVFIGTISTRRPGASPLKILWIKAGAKEDFNGVAIYGDSADVLKIKGNDYAFQFYDGFWGILYTGKCVPSAR